MKFVLHNEYGEQTLFERLNRKRVTVQVLTQVLTENYDGSLDCQSIVIVRLIKLTVRDDDTVGIFQNLECGIRIFKKEFFKFLYF